MDLPVNPPVLPMLANRVSELPPGDSWIFEPKWDGFRTLVFRDGDALFIQTRDRAVAADWFSRFEGAGLDGVVAKAESGTYQPNKRVMLKVKHERDCDCVVAGFRWHKNSNKTAVGSLLLGLYDDSGNLEHVGVCASFTAAKRKELVTFLAPFRENAIESHPWNCLLYTSDAADERSSVDVGG